MQDGLRIKVQIIVVQERIECLNEIAYDIDHADILHQIRNGILSKLPFQALV